MIALERAAEKMNHARHHDATDIHQARSAVWAALDPADDDLTESLALALFVQSTFEYPDKAKAIGLNEWRVSSEGLRDVYRAKARTAITSLRETISRQADPATEVDKT